MAFATPGSDTGMGHLRAGHQARERELNTYNKEERGHLNREAAGHFENSASKFKSEGDSSQAKYAADQATTAHKAARDNFRVAAKEAGYKGDKAKVGELKGLAKEHDAKTKEASSANKAPKVDIQKWASAKGGSPAKDATAAARLASVRAESHKPMDNESHSLHSAAATAHDAAASAHRAGGDEKQAGAHERRAEAHRDTATSAKSYLQGSGQWDESKHPRDSSGKFGG